MTALAAHIPLKQPQLASKNALFLKLMHVDTLEKYVVSTFHTMWDDDKKSLVTFPWYQAALTACGFSEPQLNGNQLSFL